MEFIKDLHEARMTKDDGNSRKLTYSDCMERLYLNLLVLETLRKFPDFNNQVKKYCTKTAGFELYKYYRIMGTDTYNLMYFLVGPTSALSKLKDPDAAEKLKKQIRVPINSVNRYINALKNGNEPSALAKTFTELEASLRVRNAEYKMIRRSLVNFDKITKQEKRVMVTKLLYAVRAKLRNSDLIDDFEKLAAIKDLEKASVKDNQPTISVPDIVTSTDQMALYKYIVGTENIQMTKKFIEHALSNQGASSAMIKGYLPAIKMLDDIVSGGPAYIQQLRTLQKRANKKN